MTFPWICSAHRCRFWL